jgi:hypothetical protein
MSRATGASPASRWRVPAALILGLVAGLLAFAFSVREIRMAPAYRTFEFCQYAEIGRNLVERGRFETGLVEPMALAWIDARGLGGHAGHWPVINRFPLPCLMTALAWRLFGDADVGLACVHGLGMALLVGLTAAQAARRFGAGFALVAIALAALNPTWFGFFVLLGLPDVWFAVFMLGWLQLTARCLGKVPGTGVRGADPDLGAGLTFGLMSGLLYLSRFNAVLFVAPALLALLLRRGWRAFGAALVGLALTTGPWLVWQKLTLGVWQVSIYSAWNLFDGIGVFKIEPWVHYTEPNTRELLLTHGGELFEKWWRNLTTVIPVRFWTLWHFHLVLPLALIGALRGGKRSPPSSIEPMGGPDAAPAPNGTMDRLALAFMVWQLLVFSALRLEFESRLSPFHGRYFFWYAAPALLAALGALERLTRWNRTAGITVTALVLAGQLAVYGHTWVSWVNTNREPGNASSNIGRDPIIGMLREELRADLVTASNNPQFVAFQGRRPAISFPANPDELERINTRSPTPVSYLFLSTLMNSIQMSEGWRSLIDPARGDPRWRSRVLAEYQYVYPPERTVPTGYVLLRRRSVPPGRLELFHAAEAEGR